MKIYRLILIGLFLTQISIAFAQTFEGLIKYNNNYQIKMTKQDSEQLNTLMGTKQVYVFKGDNYKSVYNGTFIKMQIYKGDENKNYTLTGKNDTLYWEDYSQNKDLALSYEIKVNQDTILGIVCNVIIIQSTLSKTYYYYNSQYSINSELFKKHNYGNWYYIISKTNALPLKIIYETEKYILTSIATEIKTIKLDDKVFEIQNKNKIAKANW